MNRRQITIDNDGNIYDAQGIIGKLNIEHPEHLSDKNGIADLFSPDWMCAKWNILDVQENANLLSDEQAREVLAEADRCHDATIGINWDVLECHAQELFGDDIHKED